jgi:adenylate cyclase
MSSTSLVAVVATSVAGAELVALIVLVTLLARSRVQVTRLRRQLDPPPRAAALQATGRALRAMVDTATRVRTQGVGGFVMSSLDDLSRWAVEDRAAIQRVTAPDGTVTIFFSDIEGSTALNEELGDKRWVRVLAAHDGLVRNRVEQHRGHVVKTQGDGFMVVFRDPAEAVHAAVEVQRDLAGRPGRRLNLEPVRVRIGIHVGQVVSRDGDYFGRNVALTARVAAAAAGGEVLVSDEVHECLGDTAAFDFDEPLEAELKGLSDVHILWPVLWQA